MKKLIASAFLILVQGGLMVTKAQNSEYSGSYGNNVVEEGIAKYYGKNLTGNLTSYGERYDDAQLTASHSKYPLNTVLRVTNLENNRTVDVRVNDYCRCEEEGKLLNLSREAASRLGMIASGKAQVRVEVLNARPASQVNIYRDYDIAASTQDRVPVQPTSLMPQASVAATSPSSYSTAFSEDRTYDINGSVKSPRGFAVQVTALTSLNKIHDMYDELVKLGLSPEEIFVQVGQKEMGKVYRILFGEFHTKEAASERVMWLQERGYRGLVRTHYNY
ncbi:septal ring lytic transglycosylase RlpA family protein [Cellulophaga sp. BC115SP]|uniref:septal ring lytic transglycosylase RlpA family protein n=1 Tax=Cellulophaga sp. BC115SP TaxID=2683263 RepID=UPI0014137460|nr:SPOR domain-containing protein [Cellulophaga sp. BC115SP]NBB26909.1 septal ring lytic transglycosylase RlpA family protein [Cellulophaga sp. BC115SP]